MYVRTASTDTRARAVAMIKSFKRALRSGSGSGRDFLSFSGCIYGAKRDTPVTQGVMYVRARTRPLSAVAISSAAVASSTSVDTSSCAGASGTNTVAAAPRA